MRPIPINDNIISITAQRGIARYFNKIVAGATASFGQDAVICTPISRDYGPARHIRTVRFPGSWRIGLQDRMTSLAAWITRPSVMYSVYYGNVPSQAAQVYTVYDMIHELTALPSHPFITQKSAACSAPLRCAPLASIRPRI